MNINIKATNIELTDAIKNYVNKHLLSIKKFDKNNNMSGYIEVAKTTNHHKQGDVFKAEFYIDLNGHNFFVQSEKDDLYTAIDDAKGEVVKRITNNKNRKQTLYKRGSASVKKMIKGISKRNPFTSKY